MSRLALHVEGNAIGGLGLDLQASCTHKKDPVSSIVTHDRKTPLSEGYLFTRANVVKVLVEKLLKPEQSAFAIPSCARLYFVVVVVDLVWLYKSRKVGMGKPYVVGRLGDVGESSRSRHFESREKKRRGNKGIGDQGRKTVEDSKEEKIGGGGG